MVSVLKIDDIIFVLLTVALFHLKELFFCVKVLPIE